VPGGDRDDSIVIRGMEVATFHYAVDR
jgi:hypothetical protein